MSSAPRHARTVLYTLAKLWHGHALALFSVTLLLAPEVSAKQAELPIVVLYVEQTQPPKAVLSNLRPTPPDSGYAGAQLGVADNNTTGRFLGHRYRLEAIRHRDPQVLIETLAARLPSDGALVVAAMPSSSLQALVSHPGIADRALVFNAASRDDDLRRKLCRPGLLHTVPSRAMLSDALAQFLVAKQWQRWLLLSGPHPEDRLYAKALKRSAQRFGGKIIDERIWQFNTDLRRSAQREIRAFSQARDYDVTLIADERGDIGEYIPYNTWLPRPAAGTQGLKATAWHWSIEAWGAAQLQERFRNLAKRDMGARDYAAWLALRVIGQAVSQTGSKETNTLYRYLLSEEFEVSAFKGRPLSFRPWNGQLRQPIALVQPLSLVSQSPQEGFLHPHSEMDTLGFDRPEVSCKFSSTHTDTGGAQP